MASSCIDQTLVQLRHASDADSRFLFLVYRENHIGMFKALDLKMGETLIGQQSSLQEAHYNKHYPHLKRNIIQLNGKSVGRLYTYRSDHEIILVDIAILPSQQNKGIGTRVLLRLIDEARTTHQVLRLHLTLGNSAVAWYQRHGFKVVSVKNPYIEMELNPIQGPASMRKK